MGNQVHRRLKSNYSGFNQLSWNSYLLYMELSVIIYIYIIFSLFIDVWHTIWNTAHVYWSYCICSVQWMCLLLLGVYEFIFPSICSVSYIFSVLQSHMFEFVCLHCTQFHHEFPELLYVLLFPGANFTEHLKTRSSVWRHGRFAVLMTDPNQDTCRRCEKECCVRSIGDKWARKC